MQLERHLAEMAGALKALKQEQQADAGRAFERQNLRQNSERFKPLP